MLSRLLGVMLYLLLQSFKRLELALVAKLPAKLDIYAMPVNILVEIEQVRFQHRFLATHRRTRTEVGDTWNRIISNTVYAYRKHTT